MRLKECKISNMIKMQFIEMKRHRKLKDIMENNRIIFRGAIISLLIHLKEIIILIHLILINKREEYQL